MRIRGSRASAMRTSSRGDPDIGGRSSSPSASPGRRTRSRGSTSGTRCRPPTGRSSTSGTRRSCASPGAGRRDHRAESASSGRETAPAAAWNHRAMAPLKLTRAQVLAFRRRVGALDERLPRGKRSLRQAAWPGLQDSVPRAALLSIHARVEGTKPSTWEDASLVQLWGPRHSAYVVAAVDLPYFSLGLLPDDVRSRERAFELAERLRKHLRGKEMTYSRAGRELGENPNRLRYAGPTGTVVIRWEGA